MPRPENLVRKPSLTGTVLAAILLPALWRPLARYLLVVWRDFFWPQYRLRLYPRSRRISRIDGEMDARIPFRPALYGKYLSFISLWIDTLGFVRGRIGAAAIPLWRDFLGELEDLYRDSGALSKAHPTTTLRPSGFRNRRMLTVKIFDPHYHCLPSLHILVVVYTHLQYRAWRPLLGDDASTRAWDVHLRREMLEISESVLYLKQHSISCIAGSLFYLTAKFPEADETFVRKFVGALFESENDVPADEIRAVILFLYGEFRQRHAAGIPAAQVLIDYIRARP